MPLSSHIHLMLLNVPACPIWMIVLKEARNHSLGLIRPRCLGMRAVTLSQVFTELTQQSARRYVVIGAKRNFPQKWSTCII